MRLPEYLYEHRLTKSAFAVKAGLSSSIISDICAGKGTRTDTAIAIVAATNGEVSFPELGRAALAESAQ